MKKKNPKEEREERMPSKIRIITEREIGREDVREEESRKGEERKEEKKEAREIESEEARSKVREKEKIIEMKRLYTSSITWLDWIGWRIQWLEIELKKKQTFCSKRNIIFFHIEKEKEKSAEKRINWTKISGLKKINGKKENKLKWIAIAKIRHPINIYPPIKYF